MPWPPARSSRPAVRHELTVVHLLPPDTERLMARRARVLGPAYRLFYETPLHLVRGEGVWLFDVDGRR